MHWLQFQKILEALDKLDQKKSSLAEQLLATENLQRYMLSAFLQKIKRPGR